MRVPTLGPAVCAHISAVWIACAQVDPVSGREAPLLLQLQLLPLVSRRAACVLKAEHARLSLASSLQLPLLRELHITFGVAQLSQQQVLMQVLRALAALAFACVGIALERSTASTPDSKCHSYWASCM